MLNMHVQGKKKKGRPKKRWLDNIRDDMKEYTMTKYVVHNKNVLDTTTKAGPLQHGQY